MSLESRDFSHESVQYNIKTMIDDIIKSKFYEPDYRKITEKLLYEKYSYEDTIKNGVSNLVECDLFDLPLEIYKPKIDDLWFKAQLMSDEETMLYNHKYGGAIAFPKSKWKEWYDRWMNNENKFYRYLKDVNNNYVGEIAYYCDDGKTMCSVIIIAKERGKGYGTLALNMLCDIAKSNGVTELYDDIAIDNHSINLFLKEGFVEINRNEEAILVKKVL